LQVSTLEAIAARRSIRKFRDDPVPDEALQAILAAGARAPSGKNRQPWRFVVVLEDKRAEMVRVMREGLTRMKADGTDLGSAEWTAVVMDQAPITVFVFNPEGMHPWLTRSIEQAFTDVVNIQSIGAAIQNMLLAAQELGLGSLWICDVFYAYEELREWLGETGQMVAAVSFGYPGESPAARPRMAVDELTRWL
jgi:F420 biosynthesis protein FbiB-like protein